MTVQPPPNSPRETPADRRRRIASERARLLSGTRRAEASINEALLNYGESEQDAHRRRVNEEIERVFPGVTEDEQTVTGSYEPDPRYYAVGQYAPRTSNFTETHQPMRRSLAENVASATDFTEHEDPTMGGEIPAWTRQEERGFLQSWRASRNRETEGVPGTGEWARSLSPEELEYWSLSSQQDEQQEWIEGRRRQRQELIVSSSNDVNTDEKINIFRGGTVPNLTESQRAPYEIDIRNVRVWAGKHRKEVDETGIHDTEWKQRFDKLKEDVKNTTIPLAPARGLTERYVNRRRNEHLQRLTTHWNSVVDDSSLTPQSRRRYAHQGSNLRRRTNRGVARSFVSISPRGATTRNGNLTYYAAMEVNRHYGVRTGGLNFGRLRRDHVPGTTDENFVYSYDTPIAWRQRNGKVIVPTQKYSKSTTIHQNAIRHALAEGGYHSPQQIAENIMINAYRRDRHKQTAGSPVGYEHYLPPQGAHEYIIDEEAATDTAQRIVEAHYEKVMAKQRLHAAASGRRPRNSRKPFTRRQQLRLEDAGQLRLPFEGVMPDADRVWRSERGTYEREETYAQRNAKIMQYPISLGYSPQAQQNHARQIRERQLERRDIDLSYRSNDF